MVAHQKPTKFRLGPPLLGLRRNNSGFAPSYGALPPKVLQKMTTLVAEVAEYKDRHSMK